MTDIAQRVAAAWNAACMTVSTGWDADPVIKPTDPVVISLGTFLAALAADGLTIVTVDDAKLAEQCRILDHYSLVRDVWDEAGIKRDPWTPAEASRHPVYHADKP